MSLDGGGNLQFFDKVLAMHVEFMPQGCNSCKSPRHSEFAVGGVGCIFCTRPATARNLGMMGQSE